MLFECFSLSLSRKKLKAILPSMVNGPCSQMNKFDKPCSHMNKFASEIMADGVFTAAQRLELERVHNYSMNLCAREISTKYSLDLASAKRYLIAHPGQGFGGCDIVGDAVANAAKKMQAEAARAQAEAAKLKAQLKEEETRGIRHADAYKERLATTGTKAGLTERDNGKPLTWQVNKKLVQLWRGLSTEEREAWKEQAKLATADEEEKATPAAE